MKRILFLILLGFSTLTAGNKFLCKMALAATATESIYVLEYAKVGSSKKVKVHLNRFIRAHIDHKAQCVDVEPEAEYKNTIKMNEKYIKTVKSMIKEERNRK